MSRDGTLGSAKGCPSARGAEDRTDFARIPGERQQKKSMEDFSSTKFGLPTLTDRNAAIRDDADVPQSRGNERFVCPGGDFGERPSRKCGSSIRQLDDAFADVDENGVRDAGMRPSPVEIERKAGLPVVAEHGCGRSRSTGQRGPATDGTPIGQVARGQPSFDGPGKPVAPGVRRLCVASIAYIAQGNSVLPAADAFSRRDGTDGKLGGPPVKPAPNAKG